MEEGIYMCVISVCVCVFIINFKYLKVTQNFLLANSFLLVEISSHPSLIMLLA